MNILVALNSSYIGPLCVMLKSLMISNPTNGFDIYVVHSSLKESDFKLIDTHIDPARVTIHPIKLADDVLDDAPILKRTSKETYYRLLLLDYLPDDVDRILYIDPDTVVINDISEFYNVDFKGKSIAAAGHTYKDIEKLNRIRFKFEGNVRYFNAGVVMFNTEKMRSNMKTQDIFDHIRKYKRWLFLADQDALNGIFANDAIVVDECIYNLDEKTVLRYKNFITDEWIKKNTVIVHFNGKFKPWKPGYEGVLRHFYYDYLNAPMSSEKGLKK